MKTRIENKVNEVVEYIISKSPEDITYNEYRILDNRLAVLKNEEMQETRDKEMAEMLGKIWSGGYSQGWFDPVYHEGRNYHTNGGTHTDGMSYMQRPMNYRRGYSRDEAKDHMLDTLEDMMEEATTEKERNAIRRCMEKIRA